MNPQANDMIRFLGDLPAVRDCTSKPIPEGVLSDILEDGIASALLHSIASRQ
jgi:hypothetical protein